MMTATLHSQTFGPPFDDDAADIILRSSDQVDFLVYKAILSVASPVFKDMFSLPQPSGTDASQQSHTVIDLPESSGALAALLTVIYPVTPETIEPRPLNDLIAALEAARKYDMTTASRHLLQDFENSPFVQDNPMGAFCAAYAQKLGDAARIAARESLKFRMNLDDIGDKLEHTNGPALLRLWRYHRACSAAAVTTNQGARLTWITPAQSSWWNVAGPGDRPPNCRCALVSYTLGTQGSHTWQIHVAWANYIGRARQALREHPCSKAVTHHDVLLPSYQEAMCQGCQQRICGLSEFSRYLGEEVDRRTAQVRKFPRSPLDASLIVSFFLFSWRFFWTYHFDHPCRSIYLCAVA